MSAIKEGRKCVMTAGRRKGEEVTITKILDNNFVMVKGAKKERKVSISHLDPK
jgi:ribosomal protein L14E/L6E/L27E